MRLVTYDRGGQRRLGAILEAEVVDLPDAVGHPAFPSTLEELATSSRGTVMDAARTALERDDVWDWRVKRPRILAPLFPGSLLAPHALESERTVIAPEAEVPWPDGAAWLDHQPMVAAVLAQETSGAGADEVAERVFGYTLVSEWSARSTSGAPVDTGAGVPIAIGPCIVTPDELDPQTMFVQVKIDGVEVTKGNLNGAARSLYELIARASRVTPLKRGDAFALGPFQAAEGDPGRQLWPGALVELAADGIGTLRNRVASRA